MAEPLVFNPYLQWVDVDENNIPAGARIVAAADLLRWENFMLAASRRINEHDKTVVNIATVDRTPFIVKHNGTSWEFGTLAEATNAGYKSGQTIWFVGVAGMPAWAPVGSIWTQA